MSALAVLPLNLYGDLMTISEFTISKMLEPIRYYIRSNKQKTVTCSAYQRL